MPRWLSGSAAAGIAKRLHAAGAEMVAEPASCFVSGKEPELEAGELERAEAWATELARAFGPKAVPLTAAKIS